MPKIPTINTDDKIRKLPKKDRTVGIAGFKGLQIRIQDERKCWYLRITKGGKDLATLKLGDFEILGSSENLTIVQAIAAASQKHHEFFNPSSKIKVKTFEDVANHWLSVYETDPNIGLGTVKTYKAYLKNRILPELGHLSFADVDKLTCTKFLRELFHFTPAAADKCRQCISMIIEHADGHSIRKRDFILEGIANYTGPKPEAFVMPADILAEFKKCETLKNPIKRIATKLHHHIFLRSSEIFSYLEELKVLKADVKDTEKNRANKENFEEIKILHSGKWSEIDFEAKLWTVPAIRMKMKKVHTVPLSDQVIDLLKELYAITGETGIIFPRATDKTISVPADYMGFWFDDAGIPYKPHDCRTIGPDWIKQKLSSKVRDAVEVQLAHILGDNTEQAYTYAPHLYYLEERREIMQVWSNFLEPKPAQVVLAANEPSVSDSPKKKWQSRSLARYKMLNAIEDPKAA